MKKITFKVIAFLFLSVIALQVQAQGNAYPTQTDGTFKIKIEGQDLYLTIPDMEPPLFGGFTYTLTYQALNTAKPELQTFNVTWDSATCTSCYFIESVKEGIGVVELMNPGSQTAELVVKGNTTAAPSALQLDRWNPTRGSGTQLFSENICTDCGWSGSKRRVQTSGLGLDVKVNGGTPEKFSWEAVSLSTEKFDTSNLFISNPVSNELQIKGLPSKVKEVNVYSLLGKKVLTRNVNQESELNVNTSTLTSGVYIVKISGNNATYSTKVVKQ
ncbi:T9SS type A sorting domain-containing protein [Algibacter pectinivorans]|uniref:Por secretion system C-terminal sorting domain-containing protein n=1 Tax=Algibacter pectinivorans TaxID=870482 RepID=A0A1I1QZ74_9FLAO|nr:T9SS type A sorting domain-containing protein [Algibacter pectinivorans]SFD27292.1 Por secretion system C-terminal sorting domain-containing protein [Algibacter pectinivorans]